MMFFFKSYDLNTIGKISIIKNWLGRKGLQLIDNITKAEQETLNTVDALFDILNNEFQTTTQGDHQIPSILQIKQSN